VTWIVHSLHVFSWLLLCLRNAIQRGVVNLYLAHPLTMKIAQNGQEISKMGIIVWRRCVFGDVWFHPRFHSFTHFERCWPSVFV